MSHCEPTFIVIVHLVVIGFMASCIDQHPTLTLDGSETCPSPNQDRSYMAVCATTTSQREEKPIMDSPSSIQVITHPVMDDQKALRVGDALRNVSGIQGR